MYIIYHKIWKNNIHLYIYKAPSNKNMKQPKLYNLFRFFVKYDNNFTIQSRIQVFYDGAYALLIEYLNGSDEK